jgi:hypothetical protein
MNTPDIIPSAPSDLDSLRREIASLQSLLTATLVVLLLIALGLNIYLGFTLRQSTKEKSTMQYIVAQHQQVVIPRFLNIAGRLSEFARTHPDFQAVMAKYPTIQLPPAASAAPGAAQPARTSVPAKPASAPRK